MRFLVDAQLPIRLARRLAESGHDVIHTSQLPDGNRTSDAVVASLADAEDRIVVTKDRDFRDGHLLRGSPTRLLIVITGNITDNALIELVDRNLDALVDALHEASFVELGHDRLTVHGER
ncbi:MAG: hypothetical protein GEV08_04885 [Acidimicrobiia bacterium]|nr:hypothetical protein [Acidimicrobiia bacterium]